MTQSVPTLGTGLPAVARRTPNGIYRVAQAQVSTSYATKRVLGMWVPGDAFRRGTVMRVSGASSTASPIMRLRIGGNASAAGLGVQFTLTTGPAAAVGFDLSWTQRFDGIIPTFDSTGFYAGATSLVVSTAAVSAFIQPLNYVEFSTAGTFTLFGCVLEVIPPQWNVRPYQEMFDV